MTAAALLSLGSMSCTDPPRPPHLVLIVIDSLRADHLGAYGYPRPTSPNIDALAARGVLFENARAPSSWTKPSVASLFTSRWPSEHGAVSIKRNLLPDIPTLAERLREAGYHTVGVSGNFVHVRRATALARGFEEWFEQPVSLGAIRGDAIWTTQDSEGNPIHLRAPVATEINQAVFERLPANHDQPLFLYVHYMEPHGGYDPPEPHRSAFARETAPGAPAATSDHLVDLAAGQSTPIPGEREQLIDLYDAEIASVDAAIAELLGSLATRGFAENAVVVLVSDHGEEFGEHGRWTHGISLHSESLRVPLVITDLRRPGGGTRRSEAVDLLDVATTLLALAGTEPSPGMRGRALLGSDAAPPRDFVAELHRDVFVEERLGARVQHLAFVRRELKAIVSWNGDTDYYRLDRDPGETEPIGSGNPEIGAEFEHRVASVARLLPPDPGDGTSVRIDPQTLEGLRALGYAR